MIQVKTYDNIDYDMGEAMRMAGVDKNNIPEELISLYEECKKETSGDFKYSVCYDIFPISINGDEVDFTFGKTTSKSLVKNLEKCSKAIVFVATIGMGIDRKIRMYTNLSPSKALMMQTLGAERVESLCDRFNDEMKRELEKDGLGLRPRFSPGYGGVPLTFQKNIFSVLNPEKRIGVTLHDSCLMAPSKSVTAFIGIYNK